MGSILICLVYQVPHFALLAHPFLPPPKSAVKTHNYLDDEMASKAINRYFRGSQYQFAGITPIIKNLSPCLIFP